MSIDTSNHDDHPEPAMSGGEDESSTEREGDDRHLHDDQKSRTLYPAESGKDDQAADDVNGDSPTKTQDLARAGRDDFDPNEGQE